MPHTNATSVESFDNGLVSASECESSYCRLGIPIFFRHHCRAVQGFIRLRLHEQIKHALFAQILTELLHTAPNTAYFICSCKPGLSPALLIERTKANQDPPFIPPGNLPLGSRAGTLNFADMEGWNVAETEDWKEADTIFSKVGKWLTLFCRGMKSC